MSRHNAKISRDLAKQVLKQKGYTYRQAAPALGVCYQHLAFVLNGQRESSRLLRAISELPTREDTPPAAASAVEASPTPA